jgi:hypothetical protein
MYPFLELVLWVLALSLILGVVRHNLCHIGIHRWKKLPDQLGCYGMGLEWFNCWECERCPAKADQLRGGGSYQVHYPEDGNYPT